jgi:hypothetical protein
MPQPATNPRPKSRKQPKTQRKKISAPQRRETTAYKSADLFFTIF